MKGKFRIAAQYSYYTVSDEIRSNADNVGISEVSGSGFIDVFADPRADRAAEKAATISDADGYGFNAGYGIAGWKWGEIVLDANYSYVKSHVANLEVSGQFTLRDPNQPSFILPIETPFKAFPTTVGSLSWQLPQIGGIVRFRPAKNFVPYVGLGVGKYIVDFERSKDIDQISANLDASNGFWTRFDPDDYSSTSRPLGPLKGVDVKAEDASEWHGSAGVEYHFSGKAKHWSLYFDSRFMWTDGGVEISTMGFTDFGQAIPDGDLGKNFPGSVRYSVQIPQGQGGLMDIGSAVLNPNIPNTYTKGPKDGILDPGQVFIEGGKIKYGGWLFALGARYTF